MIFLLEFISTATDSNIIDYTEINPFKISHLINGLSDHNAQRLILTNVSTTNRALSTAYRARLITMNFISTILDILSSESCENVYEHAEINKTFNIFFNKCLSLNYVSPFELLP